MKTLKKTLCLVLAMVMVFGLCAVSASAKLDSYKDKDNITYAEAVDVLSGIGILKGDESGFRPTANITRAEAAKIIAYIVIGNATQADSVKASVDPFTDVPAGHWAAGYIAYCASRGIVGGMGDGSYHPDEPVSGLAFAKMLLCALGYGKQDEYVGGDWSVKTASDAIRYGVFDDNLAGASEAYATREECALYAFNVIARLRDGNYGSSSAQYGLKKVTWSQLAGDYVATGAFGTNGSSVDANKAGTFGADYNLKAKGADADNFKRLTGHYWYIDSGRKEAITANYDDSKLKAVYTTGVTGGDIYDLLGKDAVTATTTTVNVYVDGENYSGTDTATELKIQQSAFTKGESKNLVGTGNGIQTYVYQEWTNETTSVITICIINTYLARVKEVNEATAKKDRSVTVELVDTSDASTVADSKNTIDTEDFDKEDYVLITVSNPSDNTKEKIESIAPATVLETEVTRVTVNGSKRTLVADGTTYELAKITAGGKFDITKADNSSINKDLVDGKDRAIYVDSYGYVIGVANVTTTSEYVYVAQFGLKNDSADSLTDKSVFQADIYYADGTHKIVPIDTKHTAASGHADVSAASMNSTTNCFAGSDAPATTTVNKSFNDSHVGIYKLTMYDDKAILTRPATGATGYQVSDMGLVNRGVETINTSYKMDSKTVFYYVVKDKAYDDDGYSVTAYTGINNIPVAKTPDTVAKAYICDTKVKAVLVESNFKATSGKVVYLYLGQEKDYDINGADVTYNFYKDGELARETIHYDDAKAARSAINNAAKGFVTVDSEGKIKAADTETLGIITIDSKVKYIGEGTITGNGTTVAVTPTASGASEQSGISIATAKVVDLTGVEGSNINSASKLNDEMNKSGGTATVKVAIAYDEYSQASVVYVLESTFTPSGG